MDHINAVRYVEVWTGSVFLGVGGGGFTTKLTVKLVLISLLIMSCLCEIVNIKKTICYPASAMYRPGVVIRATRNDYVVW